VKLTGVMCDCTADKDAMSTAIDPTFNNFNTQTILTVIFQGRVKLLSKKV